MSLKLLYWTEVVLHIVDQQELALLWAHYWRMLTVYHTTASRSNISTPHQALSWEATLPTLQLLCLITSFQGIVVSFLTCQQALRSCQCTTHHFILRCYIHLINMTVDLFLLGSPLATPLSTVSCILQCGDTLQWQIIFNGRARSNLSHLGLFVQIKNQMGRFVVCVCYISYWELKSIEALEFCLPYYTLFMSSSPHTLQ